MRIYLHLWTWSNLKFSGSCNSITGLYYCFFFLKRIHSWLWIKTIISMPTHLARFKRLGKLHLLCKELSTFKSCLFWGWKTSFKWTGIESWAMKYEIWQSACKVLCPQFSFSFVPIFCLCCSLSYSFIHSTNTNWFPMWARHCADSELIKRTRLP